VVRVANIIEEGRYGGPQAQILRVAERLKAEWVNTLVICPETDSERFYSEALKGAVDIRRMPMARLSMDISDILRYCSSFFKEVLFLCQLMKKEKIDIVHCNSARQFKGVIAGWLARKKVIWHLQDTWSPQIIRALFFLISFFPKHFIAAGERVREYYLGRFPLNRKPVKIIQAPVDTAVFDPDLAFPDKRIAHSHGIKVVSVGNITPAKGYPCFVDAVSHFNHANAGAVNFWIVGGVLESQRKYYDGILKKAKAPNLDNLFLYGACTDVRSVLKATDIYVCASIHEASPMSVWEAMSMGKAVISTDVGDVRRFIRNGHNGFVVPVGDGKAMAEKIQILIEDPHLRQKFGKKAREVAVRELDLSITVKKHLDIYNECLQVIL
jgi:glycosyltransferase involved in cell wall biosynthesis